MRRALRRLRFHVETPSWRADGEAQGSGFVVDRDGAILTNAHVITNVAELEPGSGRVRGAGAVYVEFSDGERVPATGG